MIPAITPGMFTAMVPVQTPISRDHHKKIVKIIQALLVFQESAVFRKPIPHKSLGWDDYKEIVKKPIDLNFVRRQYNEGKYKFVEEVLDQIQLVWENVFVYGKKDHESFDLAIKMQKNFDQLLNDFLPEYYKKVDRVAYFKQFEPVKLQKKGSSLAAQLKNVIKEQKMDIEPVKEQMKKEIEPQVAVTKRRQSLNSKKAQSALQNTNPPPVQQVKKEANKKGSQPQSKTIETKKLIPDVNTNLKSELKNEGLERKKEAIKQVKPSQVVQSKKQTLVSNKQTKADQKNEKSEMAVQIEQPQKQQVPNLTQNSLLNQNETKFQPEVLKMEIPEAIDNQESQQNQVPPIVVTLNKRPSQEQINEITNMMNLLCEIQEYEAVSKVVRILTKYEKETMVIDGEDVNFKMNEIHISSYSRIRKELEMKFYQLQTSQKVKGLSSLIVKHNVRSFVSEVNSIGEGVEVNGSLHEQKQDEVEGFVNQDQQEQMICLEQ